MAHDIVVIGASAGGVEVLRRMVRGFPEHWDAAAFVVVHFPPDADSFLPEILSRSGPLPAIHPQDGMKIAPGTIHVAPPDRHMILIDGQVRLSRGPRQNRHRPSVDTLFRSAAYSYGPRVIGVVLTGQSANLAFNLSQPANAVLDHAQGLGTIIDDDRRTISIADVSVAEGNGNPNPPNQALFNVYLSAATAQDVALGSSLRVRWPTSSRRARRNPRPGARNDSASRRLVLPAPLAPTSTTGSRPQSSLSWR